MQIIMRNLDLGVFAGRLLDAKHKKKLDESSVARRHPEAPGDLLGRLPGRASEVVPFLLAQNVKTSLI